MANRDKQERLWKCTATHEHTHEAEVCKRVHSSARQWWEREPGYFYTEELPAEQNKPASLPTFADRSERYMPPHFAEVWRDTWKMAQRVPVRVEYATRDELLGALRALALQWVPNGNGARHAT